MSDMKVVQVRDKLTELGMPLEEFILGDFDAIGEFTAKKQRARDNKLYRSVGCFFRPNYERGLLATALVKRYRPKRILELGFGRGYWTTCAAKAMHENDIDGEIVSIDVNFDRQHVDNMSKLFPMEWLKMVKLMPGRTVDVLPRVEGEFDLVYIDADHTYAGVRSDWELVRDRFTQHVVFDDYHLDAREQGQDIQVARAVDEVPAEYARELVVMDREVFVDDRTDQGEKRYGQVILRHPSFVEPADEYAHDW